MALMLVALIVGWVSCVLIVLGLCVTAARADAVIIETGSLSSPLDDASVSSAGVRR